MIYKIGQILTAHCDVELETFFGKEILKKGSKVIIGADKLAHHFNGKIQPMGENDRIKGYDHEGIAEYIMMHLKRELPLTDMMDDYGVKEKEMLNAIEYALYEIL